MFFQDYNRKELTDVMPDFYEAVVQPILEGRGWEQQDLAKTIGVSVSLISRWKKGMIPEEPNMRKLYELRPFDVEYWSYRREARTFRERLSRINVDAEKYVVFA